MTEFYRKSILPWFCLLAVIAPAPFCLTYSRHHSLFLVYATSLFALVTCCLVLDAAAVLGERQIMDPFWLLCFPFILILGFFLTRFYKV